MKKTKGFTENRRKAPSFRAGRMSINGETEKDGIFHSRVTRLFL